MAERDDTRTEIARTAYDQAYDDYLAATLVPRPVRDDLMTLAAYFGEIGRIPLHVSEPALGEIRLQWWRDALFQTGRTGHPVADALSELVARCNLPSSLLLSALEARAAELYSEPFPDDASFRGYLEASEGAHLRARAHVLAHAEEDRKQDPAFEDLLAEAAGAHALARFAVRLPYLLARGRCPIDGQRLGAAATGTGPDIGLETTARRAAGALVAEAARRFAALRPQLRRISRVNRLGVLPVALAGPYLRVLQEPGHDLARDIADPAPIERVLRLWLAARLGRF